jgi:hypothetical protein
MSRFRTRTETGPRIPGTATAYPATGAPTVFQDWVSSQPQGDVACTDTLSLSRPYTVPHDFILSRREISAPYFSGEWMQGTTKWVLDRYSNKSYVDVSGCFQGDPLGVPSMSELALRAIANMNPNTPTTDLPVFIAELKDLPHMIHQIGDLIRSRGRKRPNAGSSYLAYAFGWKPLISDLLAMIDLTEETEKRQKYLQRLAKGTRIKRKLGSGTGDQSISGLNTWSGATGSAVTFYTQHSVWESWYTAWAKCFIPIPSFEATHAAAFRAVRGLSGPSLSQAWELLPWSWLVDYFTTFGDYLAATRGGIPFTWTDLCVMRRSAVLREDSLVSNPKNLSFVPGTRRTERKERKVYKYTPLPAFRESVLSFSQLRIIGALAVSRSYRLARQL